MICDSPNGHGTGFKGYRKKMLQAYGLGSDVRESIASSKLHKVKEKESIASLRL